MRLEILVGACLIGGLAGAAPRGKVVRVERDAAVKLGMPGLCQLVDDTEVRCFARRPLPGEVIEVLDSARVIGAVRVVDAATEEACNAHAWRAPIVSISGDPSLLSTSLVGLIGVPLDEAAARVRPPSFAPLPAGYPDEEVAMRIDRDGDGRSDFAVSFYPCSADGGAMSPTTPNVSCLALWLDDGHGLRRVEHFANEGCP